MEINQSFYNKETDELKNAFLLKTFCLGVRLKLLTLGLVGVHSELLHGMFITLKNEF